MIPAIQPASQACAVTPEQTVVPALDNHVFSRLDSGIRERARSLFIAIQAVPFIDVHTHYSELEVARNRPYKTPTEFILGTYGAKEGSWSSPFDHYLGNLLRRQALGEDFIYGKKFAEGSSDLEFDKERFGKIITAISRERLHPVRVWIEITLQKYFDIKEIPICPENSERLWHAMSDKLSRPEFTARSLLNQGQVLAACTTDSPTANLNLHLEHNASRNLPLLLPTFRPDAALLSPRVEVSQFVAEMEVCVNQKLDTLDSFLSALSVRMNYFADRGCKAMDVGFDNFYHKEASREECSIIFTKLLNKSDLTEDDKAVWKTFMMRELCSEAANKGWTIYLHQGAARDRNSHLRKKYGYDAGGDTQGPHINIPAFENLLDYLKEKDRLRKMILFPINSSDWEFTLVAMSSFQHDKAGVACPLQLGPPWWFNDTIEGIEKWLYLLKQHSSPQDSIGMLSDSRVLHTVLSRNLLFRAVLAGWLVKNSAGADDALLEREAKDICYNNAARFLGVQV